MEPPALKLAVAGEYEEYADRYFTKEERLERRRKAIETVLRHKGIRNPQTGKLEFDE